MPASSQPGSRLIVVAQVAGVLAAGWLVWISTVVPRLALESLSSLVNAALFYTVLAWTCGAAITFCIYMVVALADMTDVIRFSLRSSAPAMWFAPATVLMTAPVPAAFLVSLFLVVNATRQLISQWAAIESPVVPAPPEPPEPALLSWVATPQAAFLSWESAPVLMASLTSQGGAVAFLWHHSLLGAACLAASAAILTSLSIVRGAYRPGKAPALPPSVLSVFMTFLMAAALSFGGMQVRRFGAYAEPSAESGPQAAEPAFTKIVQPTSASVEIGGGFPGVVLLPETTPRTALVAPIIPTTQSGIALMSAASIPFSGEYWMYKPPATHPPSQSIVRAGKPSELSFHTIDGAPMAMEAYQRLTPPINLACCSRLQLIISNADRYPGTVSLELILVDTAMPGNKPVSLGTVPVASEFPSEQTLNFSVPAGTAMRKFDVIRVIFHRTILRIERSAKVAIERIVFLP